jgi:hypothetical protein
VNSRQYFKFQPVKYVQKHGETAQTNAFLNEPSGDLTHDHLCLVGFYQWTCLRSSNGQRSLPVQSLHNYAKDAGFLLKKYAFLPIYVSAPIVDD